MSDKQNITWVFCIWFFGVWWIADYRYLFNKILDFKYPRKDGLMIYAIQLINKNVPALFYFSNQPDAFQCDGGDWNAGLRVHGKGVLE